MVILITLGTQLPLIALYIYHICTRGHRDSAMLFVMIGLMIKIGDRVVITISTLYRQSFTNACLSIDGAFMPSDFLCTLRMKKPRPSGARERSVHSVDATSLLVTESTLKRIVGEPLMAYLIPWRGIGFQKSASHYHRAYFQMRQR